MLSLRLASNIDQTQTECFVYIVPTITEPFQSISVTDSNSKCFATIHQVQSLHVFGNGSNSSLGSLESSCCLSIARCHFSRSPPSQLPPSLALILCHFSCPCSPPSLAHLPPSLALVRRHLLLICHHLLPLSAAVSCPLFAAVPCPCSPLSLALIRHHLLPSFATISCPRSPPSLALVCHHFLPLFATISCPHLPPSLTLVCRHLLPSFGIISLTLALASAADTACTLTLMLGLPLTPTSCSCRHSPMFLSIYIASYT
jgi:hypothetical protein